MNQPKTIEQLIRIFPGIEGIDTAILYGSLGRGEATPNSDIDIKLLINSEFRIHDFIGQLVNKLGPNIQTVREISLRKKIVAYFKHQSKVEFALCTNLSDIDRDYIGSEITDISKTILFERTTNIHDIRNYLSKLAASSSINTKNTNSDQLVIELVEKFIYEYESCSVMHRRSDGYQFYFFYNIALHVAVQLYQLSKQQIRFNFLPKGFIANILSNDDQDFFYQLNGTLFLPEANKRKRKLLDFFYNSINILLPEPHFKEIKMFCEWVFERDYFWNFRDISTFNQRLNSGLIYRTATLTLFQNDSQFASLIDNHNIKTIVDLRADREINDFPYSEENLTRFSYVKAQLDPWNQPDWFRQNYNYGTNEEIAYRYFVIGCKDQIRDAMIAILKEENGAIAVHCFAGKDRTGILISMLHLLSGASSDVIYADYLASEIDVKINRLDIVLEIIRDTGGIEPYLLSCGLSNEDIEKLKTKILSP